jgi:hypothetical protein
MQDFLLIGVNFMNENRFPLLENEILMDNRFIFSFLKRYSGLSDAINIFLNPFFSAISQTVKKWISSVDAFVLMSKTGESELNECIDSR